MSPSFALQASFKYIMCPVGSISSGRWANPCTAYSKPQDVSVAGWRPVRARVSFPITPTPPFLPTFDSEAAELYEIEQQDVYGGGAAWMSDFESEVASTLGKEAAVFCPSGVMAQLIALKIHASERGARRRRLPGAPSMDEEVLGARRAIDYDMGAHQEESLLCHPSSHLLLHEQGAYEKLIGFEAVLVGDLEVQPKSGIWFCAIGHDSSILREILNRYGINMIHNTLLLSAVRIKQ